MDRTTQDLLQKIKQLGSHSAASKNHFNAFPIDDLIEYAERLDGEGGELSIDGSEVLAAVEEALGKEGYAEVLDILSGKTTVTSASVVATVDNLQHQLSEDLNMTSMANASDPASGEFSADPYVQGVTSANARDKDFTPPPKSIEEILGNISGYDVTQENELEQEMLKRQAASALVETPKTDTQDPLEDSKEETSAQLPNDTTANATLDAESTTSPNQQRIQINVLPSTGTPAAPKVEVHTNAQSNDDANDEIEVEYAALKSVEQANITPETLGMVGQEGLEFDINNFRSNEEPAPDSTEPEPIRGGYEVDPEHFDFGVDSDEPEINAPTVSASRGLEANEVCHDDIELEFLDAELGSQDHKDSGTTFVHIGPLSDSVESSPELDSPMESTHSAVEINPILKSKEQTNSDLTENQLNNIAKAGGTKERFQEIEVEMSALSEPENVTSSQSNESNANAGTDTEPTEENDISLADQEEMLNRLLASLSDDCDTKQADRPPLLVVPPEELAGLDFNAPILDDTFEVDDEVEGDQASSDQASSVEPAVSKEKDHSGMASQILAQVKAASQVSAAQPVLQKPAVNENAVSSTVGKTEPATIAAKLDDPANLETLISNKLPESPQPEKTVANEVELEAPTSIEEQQRTPLVNASVSQVAAVQPAEVVAQAGESVVEPEQTPLPANQEKVAPKQVTQEQAQQVESVKTETLAAQVDPISNATEPEDPDCIWADPDEVIYVDGAEGYGHIDLACFDVKDAEIQGDRIEVACDDGTSIRIQFQNIDYALFAGGVQVPLTH